MLRSRKSQCASRHSTPGAIATATHSSAEGCEQSVETNRPGASSARQSAALAPALVTPKSKKKHPGEILSDYALEVVRQLGKEMHPGEYPVRAREQGIGGTVQTFLHIGADGRIADVTVANSSGNDDLDHYVIGKLAKLRLPQ